MERLANLTETLDEWIGDMFDQEHHRSHSWQHCYEFFQRFGQSGLPALRQQAALHLGFYLASWGMYRGSGFLLQHAYSVHQSVVDLLAGEETEPLWNAESEYKYDLHRRECIVNASKAIKKAYMPFGNASDTLVTKVLLGTTACIPACDRFFIAGFKNAGFRYTSFTPAFIDQLFRLCATNESELRIEQSRIQHLYGVYYPLMKLVDMYFNQLGARN